MFTISVAQAASLQPELAPLEGVPETGAVINSGENPRARHQLTLERLRYQPDRARPKIS